MFSFLKNLLKEPDLPVWFLDEDFMRWLKSYRSNDEFLVQESIRILKRKKSYPTDSILGEAVERTDRRWEGWLASSERFLKQPSQSFYAWHDKLYPKASHDDLKRRQQGWLGLTSKRIRDKKHL